MARTSIIGGKNKVDSLISISYARERTLQYFNIACSSLNILFRCINICKSNASCCCRHQLHKSLCTCTALCIWIKATFLITLSCNKTPVPSCCSCCIAEIIIVNRNNSFFSRKIQRSYMPMHNESLLYSLTFIFLYFFLKPLLIPMLQGFGQIFILRGNSPTGTSLHI